MLLLRAIALLILPLATSARDPSECASACQSPLSYLQFDGSPPSADYYALTCRNKLLVQSTFLCIRYYCSEHQISAGLHLLNKTCETSGSVEILPWSIISNISNDQLLAWTHVGYADLYGPVPYKMPVFVSESLFNMSLKTMVQWDNSLTARANYGYALFGFFGIVILLGMVTRAVNSLADLLHKSAMKGPSRTFSAIRGEVKRHLYFPPLLSHQTAEPGICGIIPPRLQSLTIMAFLVINIVLCCVRYEAFEGNIYWATTHLQTWRYISDRTGVLALANFPLIWAFAMRNNVLIWLTGWSFSTFNSFHRWVARIATIEAIVHSIGYTVFSFLDGGRKEFALDWKERYWWMGGIATIVMSLLCLFSLYPVRRYAYELFLLIHIAFAALCLIAMWYHVIIFSGEYNGFIWPCVAVWFFDRALRLGRLFSLNLPALRATATYNHDANIIRVTVPVRRILRPLPGTYFFIYIFHGYKPWESHPFTLKSWNFKEPDTQTTTCRELEFLIRPHDGLTSRLRTLLQQQDIEGNNSTNARPVRIAIEGPYGRPNDISKLSSVLFIIGGSGITVALSHLQALREELHETNKAGKSPRLRSISLVWAVHGEALFYDVYKHDLQEWGASSIMQINFNMDIYITKSEAPLTPSHGLPDSKEPSTVYTSPQNSKEVGLIGPETSDSKAPAESGKKVGPLPDDTLRNVRIFHHRPAVRDLVLGCAEEWHASSSEKMAVISCGPGGMVDDARAAVIAAVGRGYSDIEFYPEMFHW